MDERRIRFLAAVLGEDGCRALVKAAQRSSALGNALVPRTILAWLGTTRDEYEGEVPGLGATHIAFKKSEAGYSGNVSIGTETYKFEQATLFHLAASVAVAMGIEQEPMSDGLRDFDIERLGKSIDLLAKAKMVGRELAKGEKVRCPECDTEIYSAKGAVGFHSKDGKRCAGSGKEPKLEKVSQEPGPAATPTAPAAPVAPTPSAPQAPAPKAKITKPTTAKPAKPTPSYTLKVTKSEASQACPSCGWSSFAGNTFEGCFCFRELAKFAKAEPTGEGYTLTLGPEWDREAIVTFVESLGRK